ncbi:Cytochrome P450 - like 10, partial [Theobroma cacao]
MEMKDWFWTVNVNMVFKMVIGKKYSKIEASLENDERNRRSKALRDFFNLTGKFTIADSLPFLSIEATAATTVWAFSLLLNNCNALKKAQHELDTHIGRERHMQESDVKNLVYLRAIIKETMRIYPGAPLSIPRESIEECTTGGYSIPAGTRLIINLAKLQRDLNVWSKADEFQPERFLTTHKHVEVKGQNYELIPFGSGRRICSGVSLALQIMHFTVGNLLHAFEITTPSDEPIDMS